jgi:hypothetical protein
VRDQLDALQELSSVDLQLTELDSQLAQIPAHVAELDAEVQVLRNLLEKERQQLVEAEEWDQQAEREIRLQEELLAKSRGKQSGARNERELTAAQREIEAIKKATSDRDEERLQMMEAMNERRRNIAKHEAEIGELQKVLDAAAAEAREKAVEVEGKKRQWDDRRASAAAKLKPRVLKLYDNIRKSRANAVVELSDETCLGCNMSLPPQMYIDVQRMNRIFQCPYCSRIIYFNPSHHESKAEG